MLDPKAAQDGSMSFTQQGLLSLGLGICLAPFTGGVSLLVGGCHLTTGVIFDQFKLGAPDKEKTQS